MLKSNTGSSTKANPREAGKEAAAQAGKGLSGVKLAFAYASVAYDLKDMLQGISETLPGVPVIAVASSSMAPVSSAVLRCLLAAINIQASGQKA